MTFFSQLARHLADGPVALATVTAARGSTPRVAGARQGFSPSGASFGTVGGGVAEARVAELAAATLRDGTPREWQADLRGRPGELRDGVCGGVMTVSVVRLDTESKPVAAAIADALAEGKRVTVSTNTSGAPLALDASGNFVETLEPSPRLLVIGAGHIGRALAALAVTLDFAVTVQDDRPEWLDAAEFPAAATLVPDLDAAVAALNRWQGERYAALVTRGIPQDFAALRALPAANPLTYVGLLGSRKRVATVRTELDSLPFAPGVLHAPVGVEIGAETPAEIAVSIAAEMIALRRRREIALRATP